jgi:hypothetical protein
MQGRQLLTEAFRRLKACRQDFALLAPLIRLAAFLALGRGLKPADTAPGRGGWQAAIHLACQRHVIACLEHLSDIPAGVPSCMPLR